MKLTIAEAERVIDGNLNKTIKLLTFDGMAEQPFGGGAEDGEEKGCLCRMVF
jgi:hypothetical protein